MAAGIISTIPAKSITSAAVDGLRVAERIAQAWGAAPCPAFAAKS